MKNPTGSRCAQIRVYEEHSKLFQVGERRREIDGVQGLALSGRAAAHHFVCGAGRRRRHPSDAGEAVALQELAGTPRESSQSAVVSRQ